MGGGNMRFDPNDSYEVTRRKLDAIRQDKQVEIIARLMRGETVDIRKDEETFYAVNANKMDMEMFVSRDKFNEHAQQAKQIREANRINNGFSPDHRFRHIGEIPANVWFSRKEFAPDNPDREKNIKKFLNEFPAFRTVDKPV
jgi:hypothetical protein